MRKLAICIAVAGWFVLTCLSDTAISGELTEVHSIEIHSDMDSGTGLTWDGQWLWVTGFLLGHKPLGDGFPPVGPFTYAHGLDPSDGSLQSYLRRSNAVFNASGFVWDGEHFWIATFIEVIDLPVDTAGDPIFRISEDGSQIDIVAAPLSPNARPTGLAWDGTHLWLSDRRHDTVMQVDPTDMRIISSFDSPGGEPRGLTWDGSSLWSVDGSDDLIYQMDRAGNVIEAWTSPATDPWGVTYDGRHLWVLDNDSRKIYELAIPEPSSLGLLMIGTVAALGFAGSRHRAWLLPGTGSASR